MQDAREPNRQEISARARARFARRVMGTAHYRRAHAPPAVRAWPACVLAARSLRQASRTQPMTIARDADLRIQALVFAIVSAAFTSVYVPQPVLPVLQQEFGVT